MMAARHCSEFFFSFFVNYIRLYVSIVYDFLVQNRKRIRLITMNFNPIQHSNFSIIAATILSILLFYYILLTHVTKPKKPTPPQAEGSWPILGHFPKLAPTSTPLHMTLATMADRYGPIFTLRLGNHRVYIISSHELAKECYTKNDVALASRPKMLASQHLGFNYAMLGFTPYGPYWRELRKLVTSHLLSAHCLEQLRPVRTAEVVGLIKRLGLGSNHGPGRALLDLKKEFLDLSLGIIGKVVVGKDYTKEDGKDEGRRWQKALEEVFYLFGIVVVGDFVPWLRWVDLGGHERKMKEVNKELDEIVQRMIDEHRERKLKSCGDEEERDFMDVMIKLLDGTKLGGYEADHVTKATVFNLIAGGSDTTATALTWTMSLLVNNPNCIKEGQAELDLHIGKDRLVTEPDILNLPYLQAIVKEALRLYPPSPLSAQHLAVEDCTIGGYHVEKGSRVVLNMHKIQRDPRVWHPQPSEFRPERFLTTHTNVDVKGQHYELIPFSAGRRGCPGAAFALQVVHLTLASLLHAFEFSTDAPIDMTESSGLSNMKLGPLQVSLTPRLPNHLYE